MTSSLLYFLPIRNNILFATRTIFRVTKILMTYSVTLLKESRRKKLERIATVIEFRISEAEGVPESVAEEYKSVTRGPKNVSRFHKFSGITGGFFGPLEYKLYVTPVP